MDTAGRSTFILGSAPTLYLVSTQIAHNERDFRFVWAQGADAVPVASYWQLMVKIFVGRGETRETAIGELLARRGIARR